MANPESTRRENWILTAIFIAALCFHFYGVTLNWKAPFMAGHEFRQAQTAITTYYIDLQNNFSLLYETPILGKPWVSILMEVPVYEWSVILLSRAMGLPHFMAARTVSAACFYLFVPVMAYRCKPAVRYVVRAAGSWWHVAWWNQALVRFIRRCATTAQILSCARFACASPKTKPATIACLKPTSSAI